MSPLLRDKSDFILPSAKEPSTSETESNSSSFKSEVKSEPSNTEGNTVKKGAGVLSPPTTANLETKTVYDVPKRWFYIGRALDCIRDMREPNPDA